MDLQDIKSIVLMCKDEVVAILTDKGWEIRRAELLPKNLNIVDNYETGLFAVTPYTALAEWCAGRVLSIDRKYAKKILNALYLDQSQNPFDKAKIALSYRCVSLCDSYWVRFRENEEISWSEVSLRQNSLSKSLALIALTGESFILQAHEIEKTAEISTLGSYAKGWFRNSQGKLELHKTYGSSKDEVEREICASNVISLFNVFGNVKYEQGMLEGIKTSKCKLMTTDDISIVHAAEMDSWCKRNGTNVVKYAAEQFTREFAQMIVIDYLVANSDRHFRNWGFWQSMLDGRVLGLHDLYDHNNCFSKSALENEDYPSLVFKGKTMKEMALYYIRDSELQLLRYPTVEMFPSRNAFYVFMHRIKQLSLIESNDDRLSKVFS